MTITIRQAREADAAAIAAVHVTALSETYRGIVPDAVLAGVDADRKARHWAARITERNHAVFVTEADGIIVGFGSAGAARDPLLAASGEVEAVYVLKRWQVRGIGSRLMGAMARALAAGGHSSIGLWVARDNVAAVAFCRAIGATSGAARTRGDGLGTLVELALRWDEIDDLAFWDETEGTAAVPRPAVHLQPAPRRVSPPRPQRTLPAHGALWPAAVAQIAARDACPPA